MGIIYVSQKSLHRIAAGTGAAVGSVLPVPRAGGQTSSPVPPFWNVIGTNDLSSCCAFQAQLS